MTSVMPHRFRFPLFLALLCSSCSLHGQEQARQPTPADTLFQSAVTQLSQGKYQEAEASFRKVTEMEPANSRGILGVAEVWVAQKKDEDALRLLQAEAAKYPDRPGVHVG